MSALYIEEHNYPEAINILNLGIENNDDSANLYYNRACSYIKLDNVNCSLRDLDIALAFDKDIIKYGRKDEDFEKIRETEKFKKIMGD